MISLTLPWPGAGLSPNTRQHYMALARARKKYRHDCWVVAHSQGVRRVAASGGIKPAALGRVTPERRSALLKACRAYLAAGMPDQWRADPSAFRVARVRGCAPGVSVSASSMADAAVVVPDNVRRTIAPQFVDRRFAPDPGYRGPFSRAGIGRDVQTGEAWA